MLTRRRFLIASIGFALVPILTGTTFLVRGNLRQATTTSTSTSTSTTTSTLPEEATTSSTTSTTVEEETTTTAAPTTVPRSTTTTVAEPVLCPGLPHPAHHQPCPEEEPSSPPTTTTASAAPGGCEQAMIGVRAVGLPDGWNIFCSAEKTQGHAGLAYWNAPGGSYIAMNPSTGNYPGVGAHEACHAWDYAQRGSTSEGAADACALAHGYPNPYAGADDILDFFKFPEVPRPLP